jgi:hypothetical protein
LQGRDGQRREAAVGTIIAVNAQPGWLRWEPPGLRRFGYSGRVLVAGILRDIDGTGWHWKLMDVVKPPRRER